MGHYLGEIVTGGVVGGNGSKNARICTMRPWLERYLSKLREGNGSNGDHIRSSSLGSYCSLPLSYNFCVTAVCLRFYAMVEANTPTRLALSQISHWREEARILAAARSLEP